MTVSDTTGGPAGNGGGATVDTAPSFVTRESFFSFTGASVAIAAITLALSRAGYSGGWIPYVLAAVWALIMVVNAIQTNPGKPSSEYAIAGFIAVANAAMLGTVGYGAEQAT